MFQSFRRVDWILLAAVGVLMTVGFLGIASATIRTDPGGLLLRKQLLGAGIGIAGMLVLSGVTYQIYRQYAPALFGVAVLLLVLPLLLSSPIRGTRAWLSWGRFAVQPSEFARLFALLAVAALFDRTQPARRARAMPLATLLIGGMVALVLLEPDFGSAMVYGPLLLVLGYLAGTPAAWLWGLGMAGSLALAIPLGATFLSLQFGWRIGPGVVALFGAGLLGVLAVGYALANRLRMAVPPSALLISALVVVAGVGAGGAMLRGVKDYQRKRLVVFLNPGLDPLGAGYSVIQSKVAIGSGGLFGKGLFSGTQSQLGFIPERHTDFIFSLIGEELGFWGAALTLSAFAALTLRAFAISLSARDRYGSLVAAGLGTIFGFYGAVNLGMTMGMAPVAGLPLPFVSYGGSSLVASCLEVGVLLNIHAKRHVH